jgi:hypothetical protein
MLKRPAAIKCAGGVGRTPADKHAVGCAPLDGTHVVDDEISAGEHVAATGSRSNEVAQSRCGSRRQAAGLRAPPLDDPGDAVEMAGSRRRFSDEPFTTAILGLSMSSLLRGRSFHSGGARLSRAASQARNCSSTLCHFCSEYHETSALIMNLTHDEHEMLDGRSARPGRPYSLPVRYAEGAEQSRTRNVAGVPVRQSVLQNYYKDKGAHGLTRNFCISISTPTS